MGKGGLQDFNSEAKYNTTKLPPTTNNRGLLKSEGSRDEYAGRKDGNGEIVGSLHIKQLAHERSRNKMLTTTK